MRKTKRRDGIPGATAHIRCLIPMHAREGSSVTIGRRTQFAYSYAVCMLSVKCIQSIWCQSAFLEFHIVMEKRDDDDDGLPVLYVNCSIGLKHFRSL